MYMENIFNQNVLITLLMVLWVLPWKGYALWTAARTRNKIWFVILIIFNTFGLLDIFYLFYVEKKTSKDILNLFKKRSLY